MIISINHPSYPYVAKLYPSFFLKWLDSVFSPFSKVLKILDMRLIQQKYNQKIWGKNNCKLKGNKYEF